LFQYSIELALSNVPKLIASAVNEARKVAQIVTDTKASRRSWLCFKQSVE